MINKSDVGQMSPLVWAYMGDAVYEKFIREYVIKQGMCRNGLLHRKSIRYVSAKAQAKIVHKLEEMEYLTDDEADIVRRGRNSNPHSTAKNANIIDYKYATGFEALIGYLYLEEKLERLEEILNKINIERINLKNILEIKKKQKEKILKIVLKFLI